MIHVLLQVGQDDTYNVMLRYMKKGLGDGGPLDTQYRGHPSSPAKGTQSGGSLTTLSSENIHPVGCGGDKTQRQVSWSKCMLPGVVWLFGALHSITTQFSYMV
jgi:hypothetical protein